MFDAADGVMVSLSSNVRLHAQGFEAACLAQSSPFDSACRILPADFKWCDEGRMARP